MCWADRSNDVCPSIISWVCRYFFSASQIRGAHFQSKQHIMPLNIPNSFPANWTELRNQAKALLTPNHEHLKENPQGPAHEDESEAHQIFRAVEGHSKPFSSKRRASLLQAPVSKASSKPEQLNRCEEAEAEKEAAEAEDDNESDDGLPGISPPGSTGVIFVMDRAMANGFTYDDPEWANFGQGEGTDPRSQFSCSFLGLAYKVYI